VQVQVQVQLQAQAQAQAQRPVKILNSVISAETLLRKILNRTVFSTRDELSCYLRRPRSSQSVRRTIIGLFYSLVDPVYTF